MEQKDFERCEVAAEIAKLMSERWLKFSNRAGD